MLLKMFSAIAAAVMMTGTGACSDNGNEDNTVPSYNPGTLPLTGEQQQMCDSVNSFAWKMMRAENATAGTKSLLLSPLSMVYCLGMVNTGAAGQTSGEITSALGFGAGSADMNQYCRSLLRGMPELDPRTTMSVGNCVLVNKPFSLLPGYKKAVADNYNALVKSRDFTDSGFKDDVNKWVSDLTGGMIPSLIDNVDGSVVSYIINALYFKGKWTKRFDKSLTRRQQFTTSEGKAGMADMMRQTDDFKYYEDSVFQALGMNYGNGSFSMQALLPRKGKSLEDVIDAMRRRRWKTFTDAMSSCEVAVEMPRFTIEYGGDKTALLKELGMRRMFSSDADFSNFCDASSAVSKVVQKAKIEVDEDGTKAAAATYAQMELTSLMPHEPKRFYANRPFIFVITEHSTGTICFIGQYTGI